MKKIYRRPVLVSHGNATERTRGRAYLYEYDYSGDYRKIPPA